LKRNDILERKKERFELKNEFAKVSTIYFRALPAAKLQDKAYSEASGQRFGEGLSRSYFVFIVSMNASHLQRKADLR
jgi:hypothetical protein